MEAFVAKTGGQESLLQRIAEAVGNITHDSAVHDLASNKREVHGLETSLEDLKVNMQAVLSAISDNGRRHAESRETQGAFAFHPVGRDADYVRPVPCSSCHRKDSAGPGDFATQYCRRYAFDSPLHAGLIFPGISKDVRGERLRFVDAMKDATSVNVAIHLEEFKRQLSAEVMIMLQEVGKTARCRERNHLEKEIREIFDQQVERRQSIGFRPLAHRDPSSLAPSRPHSESPYPAFMLPPRASPGIQPGQIIHPMPLHPSIAGHQGRALPTPSVYLNAGSTPQPNLNVTQMAEPQRRRA